MLVRPPLPRRPTAVLRVPPAQPVVDIVVGFDFGTSSTKVVLQTPYKLGARAVAIDFGRLGHFSFSRLLPSALSEQSDGRYSLGAQPDSHRVWRDLEIRLLANGVPFTSPDGPTDYQLARAAAYVGMALREARRVSLSSPPNGTTTVPIGCAGRSTSGSRLRVTTTPLYAIDSRLSRERAAGCHSRPIRRT